MRIPYLFLIALFFSYCITASAQTSEFLKNPSFETTPRQNHAPEGWEDCNHRDESPVDVHGSETEYFGVKEFAADGECFVGMVTRDNGTYEGISSKLLRPLLKDSTYKLTIMVNRSELYQSPSRTLDQLVNFNSPTRLEIWGSGMHCQMITLLEEYEVTESGVWTEVTFYITPLESFRYLGLYARHVSDYADTNGNILIDNLQLVKVTEKDLAE